MARNKDNHGGRRSRQSEDSSLDFSKLPRIMPDLGNDDSDDSEDVSHVIEPTPKRNTESPNEKMKRDGFGSEYVVADSLIEIKLTPEGREKLIQEHIILSQEKQIVGLKNNILMRRLTEFYKKRKLDHALKEVNKNIGDELENKYKQKLLAYEELKISEGLEMKKINSDIHEKEKNCNSQEAQAKATFDGLQQLERETGLGLIYSKLGKPISDKKVEWFLSRQKKKSAEVWALRLRYVRARDAVAEREAALRALETLGDGLHVADYEQLRMDYRNLLEKIEERDDELIKNRLKCSEHSQTLAHVREKMQHQDASIDIAECDLGDIELEYLRARADMNDEKVRRDDLRAALEREKRRAGLLGRKDLLRDYDKCCDEVALLQYRRDKMVEMVLRHESDLVGAQGLLQKTLQNLPVLE